MTEIIGRNGTFFSSTDGAAFTQVAGVFSIESSQDQERIDKTDFDSIGHKEGEYGEDSVSYNVQWHRDDSDAGQDIVRTAMQNKTALFLRHRPESASGADQITSRVISTALNITNARNSMVDQTLQAESSGTVTFDTQA